CERNSDGETGLTGTFSNLAVPKALRGRKIDKAKVADFHIWAQASPLPFHRKLFRWLSKSGSKSEPPYDPYCPPTRRPSAGEPALRDTVTTARLSVVESR